MRGIERILPSHIEPDADPDHCIGIHLGEVLGEGWMQFTKNGHRCSPFFSAQGFRVYKLTILVQAKRVSTTGIKVQNLGIDETHTGEG